MISAGQVSIDLDLDRSGSTWIAGRYEQQLRTDMVYDCKVSAAHIQSDQT
jgi:hypothetical protein